MHSSSSPPLKPLDFFVLTSLLEGEHHGYRIRQEVLTLSDGTLLVEAGNLYRAIRRLRDEGLLESSPRRPSPSLDDERRRYYRLTQKGRERLAGDAKRLATLLRSKRIRKLLSETG
jgi:DNA-binding PadR family transcriptional regulator